MKVAKMVGLLTAALMSLSIVSYAGPGPQALRPVKDRQELSSLKPGAAVAHECPHCGTLALTEADKEKSQAAGFSCPECKMKFTYRDVGGGKAKAGRIECVDEKGKVMSAKVCAKH
jgi:predicted RNA-binding Zn-ribbon protein involved in translation (DUF1610 family)